MWPTPADPVPESPPRRRFLRGASVLPVAALAVARAADAALPATPPVALGPFYPPVKPADSDADLTRVAGRGGRAQGTILYVEGRLLDIDGRPLPGATLELWQANAFGRYLHPADTDASRPLDPDFQGYARLATDADGRYRIKTIKPAAYPGRTAHIHFNVAARDAKLTTQLFFENEPGNDRDGLYRWLSREDQRAATGRYVERNASMESGALAVAWDVVLRTELR